MSRQTGRNPSMQWEIQHCGLGKCSGPETRNVGAVYPEVGEEESLGYPLRQGVHWNQHPAPREGRRRMRSEQSPSSEPTQHFEAPGPPAWLC